MTSHMPARRRNQGFSIVELMVAVTIAVITGIVVLQVLAVYEARKRTVTVGIDAEMSAAVGLYMVESEVRMAGAGFTSPTGLLCGNGVNIYYNGTTISDGATVPFVRVIDGGAGPDRIDVIRSDSAFGVAPGTITQAMSSPDASIRVEGTTGLANGDLFLAASQDGVKVCTLMQMTSTPTSVGSNWMLAHSSAGSEYNPVDPAAAFTNPVDYDVGDAVYNFGTFGMRSFRVICNDAAAPSLTNTCILGESDAIAGPANPTMAQAEALASQVVDFQVQYGVAPAGSQTVDTWVDATAGTAWEAPSAADQRRIKAVRIAIVTRGNLEREMVSPDTLVIWDASVSGAQRTKALTNDERFYRYKVQTVVVPVINMIWAGV
jgi:type IV pilus assembly protein PilW